MPFVAPWSFYMPVVDAAIFGRFYGDRYYWFIVPLSAWFPLWSEREALPLNWAIIPGAPSKPTPDTASP